MICFPTLLLLQFIWLRCGLLHRMWTQVLILSVPFTRAVQLRKMIWLLWNPIFLSVKVREYFLCCLIRTVPENSARVWTALGVWKGYSIIIFFFLSVKRQSPSGYSRRSCWLQPEFAKPSWLLCSWQCPDCRQCMKLILSHVRKEERQIGEAVCTKDAPSLDYNSFYV